MLSILFKQAQAGGLPSPPACVSPDPAPSDDSICGAECIFSNARNLEREGNFLAAADQYTNLVDHQLAGVACASKGEIKMLRALITSLKSCCQQLYIKEANTNADLEAASKPLLRIDWRTCTQAKKTCNTLSSMVKAHITRYKLMREVELKNFDDNKENISPDVLNGTKISRMSPNRHSLSDPWSSIRADDAPLDYMALDCGKYQTSHIRFPLFTKTLVTEVW